MYPIIWWGSPTAAYGAVPLDCHANTFGCTVCALLMAVHVRDETVVWWKWNDFLSSPFSLLPEDGHRGVNGLFFWNEVLWVHSRCEIYTCNPHTHTNDSSAWVTVSVCVGMSVCWWVCVCAWVPGCLCAVFAYSKLDDYKESCFFYYLETELCKGVSIVTGVAYPKSDGSSCS